MSIFNSFHSLLITLFDGSVFSAFLADILSAFFTTCVVFVPFLVVFFTIRFIFRIFMR